MPHELRAILGQVFTFQRAVSNPLVQLGFAEPKVKWTAVGLVAFNCAAAAASSSSNEVGDAAPSVARYIPYPAAAPMSPAPRTCISLIALAISSTVRTSSITKRCGRKR